MKYFLIILVLIIAAASINESPRFKVRDCIFNKVNKKTGLIEKIENRKYITKFKNETYRIPVNKQVNFKKVSCKGL